MGFEQLLGNRRLKENLAASLKNNHISHFYLISGPVGSGRHTLARLLAAAILCKSGNRPCMGCNACRKAMEGSHPDFITVDDPEKKTVPVDLIRQARADIYVQPNESDYKIYLFPRAQDMGVPGQNALLKVLEEPPKYGVFILLTDNPEKLLPTVRSRCTQLQLQPLAEQELRGALEREFPKASREDVDAAISRGGGYLGQAKALLQEENALPPQTESFLQALTRQDALLLTRTLAPMEKWKRDQLIPVLQQWLELTQGALACRSGGTAAGKAPRLLAQQRSSRELMQAVQTLQTAIEYAGSNVSPAAICGWLQWELR